MEGILQGLSPGVGVNNPLSSLFVKFSIMEWNKSCGANNCSGHGECINGICLCEIKFDGPECLFPNFSYYIAFATVFFILAFICLTQLILCIFAEWRRMKSPSLRRACRVTTQKFLYLTSFLASLIRGAYFTSSPGFEASWSRSLESAYYPLVLSGASLIACFWAEVFHLENIETDKPRFLSKSYLAFVVFNIITYSLLIVEVAMAQWLLPEDQNFFMQIFNGCYAVLLFIVLIFFLAYGIEVYFKVRGSFIGYQAASFRTITRSYESNTEETVTNKLFDPQPSTSTDLSQYQINTSQLNQSRFGLLSQALMLFIVVGFLFSETLGEFWKSKVPLASRNWYDVVFRVLEVGVALWFPCVLWNCKSPEKLWILNPKRILYQHYDGQLKQGIDTELHDTERSCSRDDFTSSIECWICYDGDRKDAGPMIRPCKCRGDFRAVHHDCLRQWLVESAMKEDNLSCSVCRTPYNVEHPIKINCFYGLGTAYWFNTSIIVTAVISTIVSVWLIIQEIDSSVGKSLAAATACLIVYVCIKCWGISTTVACQRAQISSIHIINAEHDTVTSESST